jgi:hypothetical protein
VSADQKKEKKKGFFSFLSGKKKEETNESGEIKNKKKPALKKVKKTGAPGQEEEQEDEEVLRGASPGNRFSVFNKENDKKGDHKGFKNNHATGRDGMDSKELEVKRENAHQESQQLQEVETFKGRGKIISLTKI